MSMSREKKPFSMIREFHLADWFTLANAACGTSAIFATMSYVTTRDVRHVYFACALILAALVLDVLDGRIARWRQKSSALGRDLDSLADVVSFGVAPAAIAYGCGMSGFYDRIVLTIFVACGVSRLARFNVTAEALSGGGTRSGISRVRRSQRRCCWSSCSGWQPPGEPCMSRCGWGKSSSPASRCTPWCFFTPFPDRLW